MTPTRYKLLLFFVLLGSLSIFFVYTGGLGNLSFAQKQESAIFREIKNDLTRLLVESRRLAEIIDQLPDGCNQTHQPHQPSRYNRTEQTNFQNLIEMRSSFNEPEHFLTIVVPYRNRPSQLEAFGNIMHSYFEGINIKWRILVVEQSSRRAFNRAKLCNIGYDISKRILDPPSDYFCAHDVDHIPAQPYIDYSYPKTNPRHLSMHSQSLGWKLLYGELFGGVSCMSNQQMERVNGYSNEFWGWGGEDDEMSQRITLTGMKIERPAHGCFFALSYDHTRKPTETADYNRNVDMLKKTKERWKGDGLNTLKYSITGNVTTPLYVKFSVEV